MKKEAGMTYQELLTEIKDLPLDERLALPEALTHSLRDELRPAGHARSSASQVRGMLKPDGPLPTDAEITDAYTCAY
jgi:hypothetical protein